MDIVEVCESCANEFMDNQKGGGMTKRIVAKRSYHIDLEVGEDGVPVFYIVSPSHLNNQDRKAITEFAANLYPAGGYVLVEGGNEEAV